MKLDMDDICVDFKKQFDDEIDVFTHNYDKIHMGK
jgi:hypothetical protein